MNNTLTALDFDGVLCDSAGETAETAWKAGETYYPSWKGSIPEPLREEFRSVRPVLETGWQAIPMLRIVEKGKSDELLANPEKAIQTEMSEHNLHSTELLKQFGKTRDEWIQNDVDSWLTANRFYTGMPEALKNACQNNPVCIITTKQERFVIALLRGVNISFPEENIYGLDRGMKKNAVLKKLLTENPTDQPAIFVEDRLPALESAARIPELKNVELLFAEWGYNTPADREKATQNPRIRSLSSNTFIKKLSE